MPQHHRSFQLRPSKESIPYQGMTRLLPTREKETRTRAPLSNDVPLSPPPTPDMTLFSGRNRPTNTSVAGPSRESNRRSVQRGSDSEIVTPPTFPTPSIVWTNPTYVREEEQELEQDQDSELVSELELVSKSKADSNVRSLKEPSEGQNVRPEAPSRNGFGLFQCAAVVLLTWLLMLCAPHVSSHLPDHWGFSSAQKPVFSVGSVILTWWKELGGHLDLELPVQHFEGRRAMEIAQLLDRNITQFVRDREVSAVAAQQSLFGLLESMQNKNVTVTIHHLTLLCSNLQPMVQNLSEVSVWLDSAYRTMNEVGREAKSAKEMHRTRKGEALRAKNNTAWVESDELRAEHDCIEQFAEQACLLLLKGTDSFSKEWDAENRYHRRLSEHLNDLSAKSSGNSDEVDWRGLRTSLAGGISELMSVKQLHLPRRYRALVNESLLQTEQVAHGGPD